MVAKYNLQNTKDEFLFTSCVPKNVYCQGIGLKEQRQGRDAGAVSGVIKVKI